ncbi:calphotin-like [Colias croceus]|uniref:calphotin-like n=1 Tax=Colias crocea TaxID=72248 RepID=UPI001E27B94C|nr:calphotin-like [Colias croceus]
MPRNYQRKTVTKYNVEWINESLFVEWLHHFISYAKPTKDDPILLVLDNHDSHISLDVYTLCRDKGIVLLTLPPHTSHRLQPLDLTFYGPIKTAYNRECQYYMAEHPGRAITQYDVVELFTRAFNRCSNLEKAASGFRAAGIYPLHPIEFEDTQTPPAQNFVVHVPDPQASEAPALVPALEPPAFVPAQVHVPDPQASEAQAIVPALAPPAFVPAQVHVPDPQASEAQALVPALAPPAFVPAQVHVPDPQASEATALVPALEPPAFVPAQVHVPDPQASEAPALVPALEPPAFVPAQVHVPDPQASEAQAIVPALAPPAFVPAQVHVPDPQASEAQALVPALAPPAFVPAQVHVPDPQASEAQVLVPALEPPVFVPANDIQAPAPVLDILDHRAETPEKHVAIALSDIVNLPIITPKTTKRNIKKKHSVILTSTPVKDELQLKLVWVNGERSQLPHQVFVIARPESGKHEH